MPQLFLGLDLGTSALKAVVVDATGAVRAHAAATYETQSPQDGWVEQRPGDWWRACREAVAALGAQVALRDVCSIGLAGQMHGAVFLDANREVIRPAILWSDQRTVAEAQEIERTVGADRLLRLTGNRSYTGFTAPKLLWLRHNQAIAYKRLRYLLLPKDYLRLQLTGECATDLGDASGTGLLDTGARDWSGDIADALEFDRAILPPLYEGPAVTGTLPAATAADFGLPPGIPVAAGAGDQQAGAIGAGAVTPGILVTSIGTSAGVFAPLASHAPEPEGRLHTMCHSVPGQWHRLGAMLAGGSALRWLADAVAPLAGDDPIARLSDLADASLPGARGLLFLPYLNGERMPHNDPSARAMLAGLSSAHDVGDIARAVMEGVAFNLRQILDLLRASGATIVEMRLVGGGARSAAWRQIIADVYEMPIVPLDSHDGSAIGAALLGAVAAGAFASVQQAVAACVRPAAPVEPRPKTAAAYREQYERYGRMYSAMREVCGE